MESYAIQKLNDETLAAMETDLEEAARRLSSAYKARDIERYATADSDFHQLLVESCGNDLLITNYRRTITMVRHSIHYALRVPDRFSGSEREHAEVVSLLRQHRYAEATQANAAHLNSTCDVLIKEIFEKDQLV